MNNSIRCDHWNPLGDGAPSHLLFSIDFMTALAERIRPGAKYLGVVHDHDRPDPEFQMPYDGRDIQHANVYWLLPDGRYTTFVILEIRLLLLSSNPFKKDLLNN